MYGLEDKKEIARILLENNEVLEMANDTIRDLQAQLSEAQEVIKTLRDRAGMITPSEMETIDRVLDA